MKYLILLFLFTGCGSYNDVHPEFQPLFDEFSELYGAPLPNIITKKQTLGPASLAKCKYDIHPITRKKTQRYILVDPVKFNELCIEQKRWVIFHELGHCILNRPHLEDGDVSFMAPTIYTCKWMIANEDELVMEMFGVN